MPLTKSKGNMYPWVTHTHTHLAGECPHGCTYCYVQAIERRFKRGHYTGPLRMEEKELQVGYGTGRTIFIENCNDLFAEAVPDVWIHQVLAHCRQYPGNTYVFQTKNPKRYPAYIPFMPPSRMLGTTIEGAGFGAVRCSRAPKPSHRAHWMQKLDPAERIFITIEPVMPGDMDRLIEWIELIDPEFVNIGADSKTGMKSAPAGDILYLINRLKTAGVQINCKTNLNSILKPNERSDGSDDRTPTA